MTPEEFADHLSTVLTLSVSVEAAVHEVVICEESEVAQAHYLATAFRRAREMSMEIAPGAVHRWWAGDEIFYTWPLQPIGSTLPAPVHYPSVLPKWGDDRVPQTAWMA
jgi:hypothetical protein